LPARPDYVNFTAIMMGKVPLDTLRKILIAIWVPVSLLLYFYLYRHDIIAILKRIWGWLS
jgi:hypothetical protein